MSRKLIFVMGTANCGSTLFTRLMARHPSIATIGELKGSALGDVATYTCGCGEPFLVCSFWRTVVETCRATGVRFDLDDFRTHFDGDGWLAHKALRATVHGPALELIRRIALGLLPSARRGFEESLHRNSSVITAICDALSRAAFLDSSKDPARALLFAHSGAFDLRVVHLVRDGRAVVASYKKRYRDHRMNVLAWRHKLRECERATQILGSRVVRLRYEDLCGDPIGQLNRVLDFCDLPMPPAADWVPEDVPLHVLGHGSRLDAIGPLKERSAWRSLLDDDEMGVFDRVGGALNRSYGYT